MKLMKRMIAAFLYCVRFTSKKFDFHFKCICSILLKKEFFSDQSPKECNIDFEYCKDLLVAMH